MIFSQKYPFFFTKQAKNKNKYKKLNKINHYPDDILPKPF